MIRLCYLFFIVLCIHGATAAIIRKPPAFATPIYSDAYLPASMQVIYHIVDQLKRIDAEEVEQNQLLTPATSPHPPGQRQPLPTSPTIGKADEIQTATLSDVEKYYIPPERYQEEALIIARPTVKQEIIDASKVTPEINHEESEVVYGVPETNYELQESNQEVPEETHVKLQSELDTPSETDEIGVNDKVDKSDKSKDETSTNNEFKRNPELVPSDATTMTVDSIVKEIYSLMKTTSVYDKDSSLSSEDEGQKFYEKYPIIEISMEGKNSPLNITAENLSEYKERSDEFKDDKRFTLLGERVEQVPRPSLVAFLRASNVTSNPSLRQLGELYDSLSRDARRQGFSKYAGYSNEVLKFLEESADGGAGIQLKKLLEKSMENKELSRYDAMEKTKETITFLHDDGSKLSTDLRRLLPLRYVA